MSKYQKYGKKLDEIAREKFSAYEKAKEQYQKAKTRFDGRGVIHSRMTTDERLKFQRIELEYREAQENLKNAEREFQRVPAEIENLRVALCNEIRNDNKANPEDLNQNVVALLTSGVCKADELVDLYESANVTTKRYIANYARSIMPKDPKKLEGMDPEERAILNRIYYSGRSLTNPEESEVVQRFDVMREALKRTANNPAMIGYWGELTDEALCNM